VSPASFWVAFGVLLLGGRGKKEGQIATGMLSSIVLTIVGWILKKKKEEKEKGGSPCDRPHGEKPKNPG